jgi:hypothetical protein
MERLRTSLFFKVLILEDVCLEAVALGVKVKSLNTVFANKQSTRKETKNFPMLNFTPQR